jgi:hypothetical protein
MCQMFELFLAYLSSKIYCYMLLAFLHLPLVMVSSWMPIGCHGPSILVSSNKCLLLIFVLSQNLKLWPILLKRVETYYLGSDK